MKASTKLIVSAVFLLLLLIVGGTFLRSAFAPLLTPLVSPVFSLARSTENLFHPLFAVISSKQSLEEEKRELRQELIRQDALLLSYEEVLRENRELRQLLGRETQRDEEEKVFARVLSRPPFSPYDTFLVDVGRIDGVGQGDFVFGNGEFLIGRIDEAGRRTSRVRLFSSPGESFEVLIGDERVESQAVGRGGGNFEALLPRGVDLSPGDTIVFPALTGNRIFALIGHIDTSASETFQRILFKNPVNLFELTAVTIVAPVDEEL